MNPRDITQVDVDYYDESDAEIVIGRALITGPGEEESGIEPCPAIVSEQRDGQRLVHVAWVLDEIEMMHLVKGGTLWLTTWGGLPIHAMHVQEPAS
jgi:hypothetical protein